MGKTNLARLLIPSQPGFEKLAIRTAAQIAEFLGLPADRQSDLGTAVAEACLNAMQHGNRYSAGTPVTVDFYASKQRLQVEIGDSGAGLEKSPAVPELERKIAGQEAPGGWGIFLMQRLVDRVEFFKSAGRGHITRLTVVLPPRQRESR